jgi:hypothetical protein
MTRPARVPPQLSESIHHQLNTYALAASAAGVGVLALAQRAEGRVVYTSAHHVVGPQSSYKPDLNHDGIAGFTIVHDSTSRGGGVSVKTNYPANPNGVMATASRGRILALALKNNTKVGVGNQFFDGTMGPANMVVSHFAGRARLKGQRRFVFFAAVISHRVP